MSSEHHVLAALDDLQLRLDARVVRRVGRRDDVEDNLAGGSDANGDQTERPDGSPEADIDRDRAARD
jgi:hypothetical protein